jgi:hypothetical protein
VIRTKPAVISALASGLLFVLGYIAICPDLFVERAERNVSIDNIARIAKGLKTEPRGP